ncbi:hypothetical protein OKJ48_20340 [Streptomyces kunmingensis]|uniref:Sortase n=1 Tax=Streptomyces kunmingensis TaxID=68225 RepID=A0ABU6CDP7_9ACTN|nr:hypothetical protein [Streptomyces kunmingensis]MEB3962584.1 hypothetical protein [Streptomyces kunmingensis]
MRAGPLALSAASAAVVLVAAPVATAQAADHGGSVSVSPYSAAAGTEVDLRVSGCDGRAGRAHSDAFVSPGVLAPSADRPTLFAEARVKSSATPGDYEVEVACDGVDAKVRGTVQVLAHSASPSPAPTPTALVHAGGGGAAAHLAAPHSSPRADVTEGPGTRHAVIGLVLTAVAAVAVAFRSVRRRRSSR